MVIAMPMTVFRKLCYARVSFRVAMVRSVRLDRKRNRLCRKPRKNRMTVR